MKTIERLVKRFNRVYPDYYVIYITEPVCGLTSRHTFTTCRDFGDWINGVVLD